MRRPRRMVLRVRGALGHSHAGLPREECPLACGDCLESVAGDFRPLTEGSTINVNVVQRLRPDAIDPIRYCPVADAGDIMVMMIIMVVVLMASPTP